MSFGISFGDFVAVGNLIKSIIRTLQTSVADHEEFLLELHGLQRARDKIEHFQYDHEKQTEVNAVKVAALTFKYRLVDFAGKLKKYESLGHWGFSMEAEVRNLRAYLIAHVGYLNMRLTTLGLTPSWHVSLEIARQQNALEKHIADSQATALNVASELAAHRSLIQENTSWAQRHISLFSGYREIAPLLFFSRVEVSKEIAVRVIKVIAEIFEVTVQELREICSRKPDFVDSLDLHSLLSIAIIERLTKLKVEVPRSDTSPYLVPEVFELFLKALY